MGKRVKAEIYLNGKNRYLGCFDSVKAAALAYDRAAIKAGRPTSSLNFPSEVSNKDFKHVPSKVLEEK